jgi:hypothetical protein
MPPGTISPAAVSAGLVTGGADTKSRPNSRLKTSKMMAPPIPTGAIR